MLLCVASSPASSRDWKATPSAIAQNYATILDNRGKGDIVLLIWFVPQIAPSGSSGTKTTLEKYVVITVVHAHLEPTSGVMSFDDINALVAKDQSEKPLTPVPRDTLPPVSTGMLASMETVFRQSFGAMGKGMKTFVFDAGAVHSCEKGGMSVPFADETYTWETPIPGCQ
jgi:hypothetical protein